MSNQDQITDGSVLDKNTRYLTREELTKIRDAAISAKYNPLSEIFKGAVVGAAVALFTSTLPGVIAGGVSGALGTLPGIYNQNRLYEVMALIQDYDAGKISAVKIIYSWRYRNAGQNSGWVLTDSRYVGF